MCSYNILLIKKNTPKKLWFFLNKIRFFSPWDLFSDIDQNYYDIVITAKSEIKDYSWRLRKDKDIGLITLHHNLSRLTLTFYYKKWFAFFLNDYLLNKTKEYMTLNSEDLKNFKIEEIWYSSFNEEIRFKNIIFNWDKK